MTEAAGAIPASGNGSGWSAGLEGAVRRAVPVLLVLGALWRVLRWALRFPFEGDESFLVLNLLDGGSWLGVLRPMRAQVAPFLFLWAEKAALQLFGASEHGLRLLPLAAALLGLVLFWRFVQRVLDPLSAAFAAALLAVSYFPLRFSSEIKPYSLDLLATVVLLSLGLDALAGTTRLRALALLVPVAPLLVSLSYPSCLVVASVSTVLLPAILRDPGRRAKSLFAVYNLAAFVVFLVSYRSVGSGQFEGQGGFSNEFWQMQGAFPPARPVAFLAWAFRLVTGLVFAYPLGDVGGAAAVTFLLSVWGAVVLRRSGRPGLGAMCLLPFGWTLLVAAARLYPFGPHPRVVQHLAPAICLLAGTGLAAVVAYRSGSPGQTLRRVRGTFVVLGGLATAGIVLDVVQPHRSKADDVYRSLAREIRAQAGGEDHVVYVQSEDILTQPPAQLELYLRRESLKVWIKGWPDLQVQPPPRQVWVIALGLDEPPPYLLDILRKATPPFALVRNVPYPLKMGSDTRPPIPCSVSHWKRSSG